MGEVVVIMAIGGGVLIALVAIGTEAARDLSRTKEREQSRREIAAYVAEGNMTADEGERLMNAGQRARKKA